MAGSLVAIRDRWQIEFARFFPMPSLTSTCSSLAPVTMKRIKTRGTWIPTSAPIASLQLLNNNSRSDFILTVYVQGTIIEEHYVSKLCFSWPQVTCVPEYPSRGSRAVFVSYKDPLGEIQKFALRFLTTYDVESFMSSLRGILRNDEDIEPLSTDFRSGISSQSEFVPSKQTPPSVNKQELSIVKSVKAYSPQMQESFNNELDQYPYIPEMTNDNTASTRTAFPPSFTSLITNCCPEIYHAAAVSVDPTEADLKYQIVKYMEDSSFHEMLMKVEKVIDELSDDLTI